MSAPSVAQSTGINLASLLGVLFVGLKLTGYIDWSWWWVLAPFWIPPLVFIAVLIVVGIVWLCVRERRR